MVQFHVGDVISICASVGDICGADNWYFTKDINISYGQCSINVEVPGCLDLSNVELEFQWTNAYDTQTRHNCDPVTNLKTLGIAYTSLSGAASIGYTLTQQDLDLYNANPSTFDIRVCIKNKANIDTASKTRDQVRPGDKVIIAPEPVATHIIKLKLSDWEYISYLQEAIVDVSIEIGKLIPIHPTIQYIKTEYNAVDNTLDIYTIYTGTAPQYIAPKAGVVPGSMEYIDYIKIILPLVSITLASVMLVTLAPIWAAGGPITWIVVGMTVTAIALLAVTGTWVVYLATQSSTTEKVVSNYKLHEDGNNQLQGEINALYKLCIDGKISNIETLKGIKETVRIYATKKKADFELIQIETELNTYLLCTDGVISKYQNDTQCGIGVPDITLCQTPLMDKINSEISTKYLDTDYIPPGCDTHINPDTCKLSGNCIWYYDRCVDKKSCIISEPIYGSCLLSYNDLLKGSLYAAGVAIVGAAIFIYAPPAINAVGNTVSGVQKQMDEWNKILNKPTIEIKPVQKDLDLKSVQRIAYRRQR